MCTESQKGETELTVPPARSTGAWTGEGRWPDNKGDGRRQPKPIVGGGGGGVVIVGEGHRVGLPIRCWSVDTLLSVLWRPAAGVTNSRRLCCYSRCPRRHPPPRQNLIIHRYFPSIVRLIECRVIYVVFMLMSASFSPRIFCKTLSSSKAATHCRHSGTAGFDSSKWEGFPGVK